MKFVQVKQACALIKLEEPSQLGLPLLDQVAPLLEQNAFVILDCEEIELSSLIIGEFINVHRHLKDKWQGRAHGMALVNLSPSARKMFETTKIDKMLPFYNNITDAMGHFSRLKNV